MLKRPQPSENEDDLLRMQEEFFKNKDMQPSAQVVNLRKTESHAIKRNNPSSSSRTLSKYALSKGLRTEKRSRTENTSVIGDIIEKNFSAPPDNQSNSKSTDADDDKVYFPKILPSILGEIVEKNNDNSFDTKDIKMPATGFPITVKRDLNLGLNSNAVIKNTNMDVDESFTVKHNPLNLPSQSYILSSNEAEIIHDENIKLLSKMSEEAILEEKQKLITSIEPDLANFIKSKRQNKIVQFSDIEMKSVENKEDIVDKSLSLNSDMLWENDVLSNPKVTSWLNFNNLEKDKLQWMQGIKESAYLKPNEPYEARFNFNGYLLPYTMEYTEENKTLFHHGDEPHRPGYAITELIELSRSTIIQQRVMALNTIAGILEYYSVGTYKNIIDIPLSKLFFVIRIALDENKVIILEPALRAMRNLMFNRIDEASLDALLGFEEGTCQPSLENDKSEIEEMESNESELKDYHLAEIDIVAAILRTDILQRLYYIMSTIRPSFNCIQYSLQILTRLARDSTETANKIVQMDYLMETIVKHFMPITGVNFVFDPSIIYKGKPILAALKLIRILSLQTKEIGQMLTVKYDILKPLSTYINSGVDSTYGVKIQTEAFCILTNLLSFDLCLEEIQSLCPLIITILYKHIQQTDIFMNTPIVVVTHAAVVLQFVNKLLNCTMINLEKHKGQIYPLLKEGVQKWLMQVVQVDNYTCGHLRLVSSVLDCVKTVLVVEEISLKFLNDYLITLSKSQGFKYIINNLLQSSNLLSDIDEKDLHLTKNLVNLGTSVIDSEHKVVPILNETSSIPFLVSLYKLLVHVNDKKIMNIFLIQVLPYLKKVLKKSLYLTNNWFTRMEVDFLYYIVLISSKCDSEESLKDLIYAVANKLCYILRSDKQIELAFLFDNIIFNKYWFTTERLFNLVSMSDKDSFSEALSTVEDIKQCYSSVLNFKCLPMKSNIAFKQWQTPIIPRDWIYLPILTLYSKSQELVTKTPEDVLQKKELVAAKELTIKCSLEWILFNEICFADLLSDIDVTDRFCRIMCVFLCDNSLFLDVKVKQLLHKCTQILFKHSGEFNFDKELIGLNNFQDLYTQFLEQYQSVSYGDYNFAACVLVPLAQKHNNKWRKLLWSEYAGCLRSLDCPESFLCSNINDYLEPEETDDSLIKSYFRCLSNNLLRPETISYKIAKHHVDCYKKRKEIKA